MQDLNLFSKRNGGEAKLGQMRKVNIKLDDHHCVSLSCSEETIQATFEPLIPQMVASEDI